ncbi:MAG: diacylglycerol kinase [Kiritimatiellae bacterium]|nr:diacylglycerol kinase [Kiritimatiellia bacterium]
MRNIAPFRGIHPVFGPGCHVAPGASVVGDVVCGAGCSVWHGASVRGDVNRIRIGNRVNVQEGCSLHVSEGGFSLEIGDDTTIGHNATVHGCRIEGHALVGRGAVLLDGCRIGRGAVVAAGAVVPPGCVVGAGELWAGVPARRVRALSPAEQERLVDEGVRAYEAFAREHAAEAARPRGGNPFRAAFAGLAQAFCTQRNLRLHAAAAAAAVALGAYLGLSRGEWIAVVLCIALVSALECANTALEAAVDLAEPSRHPLAKRAKDCAAAAVLLAAFGAAAVGAIVFLPKLLP